VARSPECPVCVRREFAYLDGTAQPHITLCGRDSVQIHERGRVLDLATLKTRLASTVDDVRQNDFLCAFASIPTR
jgi:adenylyltransferase/sulfurtransferase